MNQYSLLARVAPRLTTQFENLATESLLYLLDRYSEAREAFVDLAVTAGYVGTRDLTFDTQVHMQHGNIPDLVGATRDGAGVLLVESKFWAPLTPNQPIGYLRRLHADKEGMVLFVAPKRRYEELWQQLAARCQAEGLDLRDETGEPPNWHSARTSEVDRLAYVSWAFVLDRLEGRLEEAGQDRGAHEVWQLRGLCQRLEEPMRLEDLRGSDQRKVQLRSIVDEVAKRLVKRGVFATKGYRATPGPYNYRRFGTLSGHVNWFVEYNEQNAASFGESLLWVGGRPPAGMAHEPSPDTEAAPPRSYELGERVFFPLDVPTQEPREVVLQSLVAQVERIIELLPKRDRS